MTAPPPLPALGVTAGLDPEVARSLASRCAELGYRSLWSNDDPEAPGLETLARFAAAAPRLELGVGVLPLHRYSPARIAAEVERLGLDVGRLWIGVGAGRVRPSLAPLRAAVAELRILLPGARLVVAAMRPALCHLGGEVADGVLLNWMLPEQAAAASRWVAEGAEGRPAAPVTGLYVRVAVGPGAKERLRTEEARYRDIDEGHRRHFSAMDVPVGSVGVVGSGRREVVDGLATYRSAVDLPIVRELGGPDLGSLLAVAEAAAP